MTTTMLTRAHGMRAGFISLAVAALTLTTVGCQPSEADLAKGKERAALAGQQSALVEQYKGSKGCTEGRKAIGAWRTEHEGAIAASDAWWGGLDDSTKDKIYAAYPEYSQSNKDRISQMVYCGSDDGLWHPSS